MAISLEKYQSETEVMQIGGYTIAPPQDLKTDSFFKSRPLGVGEPGSGPGTTFLGSQRLAFTKKRY